MIRKGIFPILCLSLLFNHVLVTSAYAGSLDDAYQWSEDEGPWVLKAHVGGAFILDYSDKYTENGLPATGSGDKHFFDNTVNIDAELSYRWTDHISFSGSIGYQPYTSANWTYVPTGVTDSGKLTSIPLSAFVQYHFAPYGQLRPYIGAGWHYNYFWSTYDLIEATGSGGPVLQGGVDWWLQKHWGVNVDIRKYWSDVEIDFKKLTGTNYINEPNFDPLTVSAGVMHRF